VPQPDETFSAPSEGFPLPPVHPGEILAEELAARAMSAHALALRIRVPANRVSEIIGGRRRVTAETALRLGRYFGTGAQLWMDLQSAYDLAVAREKYGPSIEREVAEA
jgi:addiction module HigA family antidote